MQIMQILMKSSPNRHEFIPSPPTSPGRGATLINNIHWRFRADNSAIHQADLTIRSVLTLARAKPIKVIDCGNRRFLSLTRRSVRTVRDGGRAGVRKSAREFSCEGACTQRTNSRDNASHREREGERESSGRDPERCLIRELHVNEDSARTRRS